MKKARLQIKIDDLKYAIVYRARSAMIEAVKDYPFEEWELKPII